MKKVVNLIGFLSFWTIITGIILTIIDVSFWKVPAIAFVVFTTLVVLNAANELTKRK